jgi:hypothetical protein
MILLPYFVIFILYDLAEIYDLRCSMPKDIRKPRPATNIIVAPEVRSKAYESHKPVKVKTALSTMDISIILIRDREYFSAI